VDIARARDVAPGALSARSDACRDGGSEGGGGGSSPPYCLHNKGTLLQSALKISAINECLGVEEGVHILTCITMELSFNLL
jgi:hypothetical protein